MVEKFFSIQNWILLYFTYHMRILLLLKYITRTSRFIMTKQRALQNCGQLRFQHWFQQSEMRHTQPQHWSKETTGFSEASTSTQIRALFRTFILCLREWVNKIKKDRTTTPATWLNPFGFQTSNIRMKRIWSKMEQ